MIGAVAIHEWSTGTRTSGIASTLGGCLDHPSVSGSVSVRQAVGTKFLTTGRTQFIPILSVRGTYETHMMHAPPRSSLVLQQPAFLQLRNYVPLPPINRKSGGRRGSDDVGGLFASNRDPANWGQALMRTDQILGLRPSGPIYGEPVTTPSTSRAGRGSPASDRELRQYSAASLFMTARRSPIESSIDLA